MIYKDLKLTVMGNNSKTDSDIYVYRNDRNIDFNFKVEIHSPYKYVDNQNMIESTSAAYSQIVIMKQGESPVFGKLQVVFDNVAKLTITADMIDELNELGDYDFFIRLYDRTRESAVTIPPVIGQLHVLEPMGVGAEELTVYDEVGKAMINEMGLTYQEGEEPVFNGYGIYNKTIWKDRDIISKGKMNKIEEAMYKHSEQFNTILRYPPALKELELISKYGISRIDVRYDYCHVHRYGGDNTNTRCNSNAIQVAIDYNEYLGANKLGVKPIKFEGGTYLITKPILIKGDKLNCLDHVAVTLEGVECKMTGGNFGTSTCLNLAIPNQSNLGYATAFLINVKTENGNDLDIIEFNDGVASDGGVVNLPSMSNIEFKNFSVKCLDDSLNNNFIKGHRFRSNIINIHSQNLYRTIYQPQADSLGNNNYCDFTTIENISFNSIKHLGIEVSYFDNSCIRNVIEHRIKASAVGVIRINSGGSIKLERLQHAYQFIDGSTTPRQDGVGVNGDTYFLLLNSVSGVSVDCMYFERWLKDYVIRLYNVSGVTLSNVNEKYLGNGFIMLKGYCNGLTINNIVRNVNRTKEYSDFYLSQGSWIKGFKINNFINKKYYNEEVTLSSSNLNNLTKVTNDNEFYMPSIQALNSQVNNLELEKVRLNVLYLDTNWVIRDMDRNDVTDEFNISFSSRLYISHKDYGNKNCIIESVEPIRTGATVSYTPEIFYQNAEKSVTFYDKTTGEIIQTESNKMNFIVTLNLPSSCF